jgi:DNA-binding MarR family transcriptional regulator
MKDTDRRDNLLGAFVLSVCDRIRRETEEAIGHSGASAAAAVRVVDRLVEQNLVRRRPAGKGPAVALRVTAAGERQARRILQVRHAVIASALPGLSTEESETLVAILERALTQLSSSPGTTHCRLCDMKRCPRLRCPVMLKQIEIGAPPAESVPVPD